MLELDGHSLTRATLAQVARGGRPVGLASVARARMGRTRDHVEAVVATGAPVYGITTGFGKLSDVAIVPADVATLQRNLVLSHAAGVGDPLPDDEVRAMLVLRANVLASGHAGVRPLVVDALLSLLAAGIVPVIPEQGSVGASGDLVPLSHLACALLGEGRVRVPGGGTQPAAQALAAAGLAPLVLEAKEGLALVNGTQAHTAVAALALHDAWGLWAVAHVAGAMTLEALMGSPDAFDARIQAARGQVGQATSAALLRALLADSPIRESHRRHDPRVQDAYALRCMPQVHGPVRDAIAFAEGIIARELNAATDNPLVFEDGAVLAGGNFHGQAVALAADVLAIALTNLAVMAERRIDRLVNPDLNFGLTPFLARRPGVESGFMMVQVGAAALASECKGLAHPASVDSIPTDGGKEDVVPMAMRAAVRLRRIVRNLRHVLAMELLCAAQALDDRAPLVPAAPLRPVHAAIRARVAPLTGDRMLDGDLEGLADAIAAGAIADAAPIDWTAYLEAA
jgi:histidine ammonia-lyase